MYSNRHEQTDVRRRIQNSERGQLNDVRSTIVEDYRRSTTSTIRSLRYYQNTISDYRAVKELHEHFKQQAQRSSENRAEISADRAESLRTDYFSEFFAETTRKLGISASRTFERVSDEFEYRFRSEANHSQRATKFSSDRDRKADQSFGNTNEREVRLSEQLSRKISGFSTGNIFTALDVLDQRRELQRAQERKNDRGYDSPSPF